MKTEAEWEARALSRPRFKSETSAIDTAHLKISNLTVRNHIGFGESWSLGKECGNQKNVPICMTCEAFLKIARSLSS
jgi:hypothetical protein